MVIGIIPAAGRGTRSGLPYPKELLPIKAENGRIITAIESAIQQLANAEISSAIIIIRPEKQMIADYLGNERYGVDLTYSNQKTMHSREGLPDAIMSGYNNAKMNIMLMGDTYFTYPYVVRDLLSDMAIRQSAIAGIGTWTTDEPERFGIVSQLGQYVAYVEDKPQLEAGTYRHWGVAAFRQTFWQYIAEEQDSFSNALNHAAALDRVISTPMRGRYLDFGLPESIIEGIKVVNP